MKTKMALACFVALGAAIVPGLVAEKGREPSPTPRAGVLGHATSPLPLPPVGLLSPERGKTLLDSRKDIVLIDVRTAEEFSSGHIRGASLLPYDAIDAKSAAAAIPSKDSPVILYCRSGRRSAIAAAALLKLGYKAVYDMGGINAWPYGTVK